MNVIFLVVVLSLIWAAVTGTFTMMSLLLGAAIGVVAALLIRDQVDRPHIARRLWRIIGLALLFIYELIISAWRVAVLVASPNMKARVRPAIIAYPLSVETDREITLLAMMITLTPGTLSIDVAEDRSVLYIHALEMTDREETIRSIKQGFERRIMEVFQ